MCCNVGKPIINHNKPFHFWWFIPTIRMVILGMVCYVYIITLTITPFENMKDQSLVASCGRKTHKTTISLQLSQSRLRLFWSQRIREAEFNSQIIDGIGQQPLHLGEQTFSQTAPGRAETQKKDLERSWRSRWSRCTCEKWLIWDFHGFWSTIVPSWVSTSDLIIRGDITLTKQTCPS